LYENYDRGNTESSRAIAWSVSKSVLSALFGIAVSQGKIASLDDPVAQYVPELRDSGYGLVRLKDVLQMSSGIAFNEDYGDFNSDINAMGRYFALDLPLQNFVSGLKNGRKPGTFNHYVSMDTQVLGMVLAKATGRTIADLTEEQLWKPLGMEADAAWLIDGAGMEATFGGLNAVLRDYARFGRLYLHQGNWNGVQVVPADWVRASVTPDAPHLMPGKRDSSSWVLGYGYQWWVPGDLGAPGTQGDFLAIGIYGQAIYVSPATGIVIARTAAYQNYNKDGDAMELESIEFFRSLAAQMK
jgi:CubicO group peptidase (beta-lactamase class C family)